MDIDHKKIENMITTFKNKPYLIFVVLIPIFYLGIIYTSLPTIVPIHWNIEGEIDKLGDKSTLIYISALPLLVYLIFTIMPKVDPKNKLMYMGNKFQKLKNVLTVFVSLMIIVVIHLVKHPTLANPKLIIMALGIMYIILGNYFKTIKANYFIGIRTPWSLENEMVWKNTHILGGKLWFVGGILIVLSSWVISQEYLFYVFLSITLIITLIPIIYSYILFKNINKTTES